MKECGVVDVGRPPPGPRPVLWPPANFSPQCTQLMSSSQQSRAECWQQSRESNCCQVSPSLPTGSAASRGGRRRKYWQFKTFNCHPCQLESISKYKSRHIVTSLQTKGCPQNQNSVNRIQRHVFFFQNNHIHYHCIFFRNCS